MSRDVAKGASCLLDVGQRVVGMFMKDLELRIRAITKGHTNVYITKVNATVKLT
jgi:uncharacterized protein YwlG (UPF0340 family)